MTRARRTSRPSITATHAAGSAVWLLWLLVGAGFLVLAVTDSIYVRLLGQGRTALTGGPLVLGWCAALFLVALATLVPSTRREQALGRESVLFLELIPYVPVLAAVVVSSGVRIGWANPFQLWSAVLLLLAVSGRQVMIVYQNVALTRDLEAKVVARTAELGALGSIVTSSSDAIVGISMDAVISSWNPAAEKLYGHRSVDMVRSALGSMPAEQFRPFQDVLDRALRGQVHQGCEVDWARPDGDTVPVAITVSPILDGDQMTGVSGSAPAAPSRSRSPLGRARAWPPTHPRSATTCSAACGCWSSTTTRPTG